MVEPVPVIELWRESEQVKPAFFVEPEPLGISNSAPEPKLPITAPNHFTKQNQNNIGFIGSGSYSATLYLTI